MSASSKLSNNPDLSHLKYVNRIPKKTQLGRLLWNLTWLLLIRTNPRWCLHGWRRFLYRCFGAKIGKGSRIDPTCKVWAPWNLTLGDYTALAEGVDCYCVDRITIGSKVTVSQRTFLCTASHRIDTLTRELIHAPIRIGDHVWVCAESFIGPGVSLGEGAIVGARSVVLRDVGAWHVVAGNPARFIKERVLTDN